MIDGSLKDVTVHARLLPSHNAAFPISLQGRRCEIRALKSPSIDMSTQRRVRGRDARSYEQRALRGSRRQYLLAAATLGP